ncbi:hypothetical protein [Amycolatopsis sp. lyj-346]
MRSRRGATRSSCDCSIGADLLVTAGDLLANLTQLGPLELVMAEG